MEFPIVQPDQAVSDGIVYVGLNANVEIKVTTTNSLIVARKWLKAMKHFGRTRNQNANMQVGIASHGQNSEVITLARRKHCLIVHVADVMNGPVAGRFPDFLSDESISFVSSGPVTVGGNLKLHGYRNALDEDEEVHTFEQLAQILIGNPIALDPVVAAGDWVWPLTHQQMILSTTQA